MPGARNVARQSSTVYATAADFCRVFTKDMNRLYLLSLLLTADPSAAETCFVQGLETSGKNNLVFKEWAESWARRTIIQNAVQMIRPNQKTNASVAFDRSSQDMELPAELAAAVSLPAFERFVFVIVVIEGYSEQECSLLLGCTRADANAARIRALRQIGNRSATAASRSTSNESESLVHVKALSHLAATA
ncbi:MAG TPA: hypothetical protein VMB18_17265 [Terriglobales bacterium]|nr:hypothetical protein [Terriglobales bacterium]